MYLFLPVSLGALDPSRTPSLTALSLSLSSTAALWSFIDRLSEGSQVFALKPVTSSFRSLSFLPFKFDRNRNNKREMEVKEEEREGV